MNAEMIGTTRAVTTTYRIERDDDVPRGDRLDAILGGEPRSGQFTGTKALMLAVLEDAIRSYLSGSTLAAKDAEYWILSPRRHSPFSFVVVCEVLGLDADAVRETLVKMRDSNRGRRAFPRARHNVRIPGRVCVRRPVQH